MLKKEQEGYVRAQMDSRFMSLTKRYFLLKKIKIPNIKMV